MVGWLLTVPEVGHEIEHRLLVELVSGRVHQNWSINEVSSPVRTALHVQA